jgi:hypothetical protein
MVTTVALSQFSSATSAVIIFVVDAIGKRTSAFFAQITASLEASISIAALAEMLGAQLAADVRGETMGEGETAALWIFEAEQPESAARHNNTAVTARAALNKIFLILNLGINTPPDKQSLSNKHYICPKKHLF